MTKIIDVTNNISQKIKDGVLSDIKGEWGVIGWFTFDVKSMHFLEVVLDNGHALSFLTIKFELNLVSTLLSPLFSIISGSSKMGSYSACYSRYSLNGDKVNYSYGKRYPNGNVFVACSEKEADDWIKNGCRNEILEIANEMEAQINEEKEKTIRLEQEKEKLLKENQRLNTDLKEYQNERRNYQEKLNELNSSQQQITARIEMLSKPNQ